MEITILNKAFTKVKEFDTFYSLLWVDRYNGYGDFEILVKADRSVITLFQEGYYLSIEESEHIMIVETLDLKTDVEDGDKFTIKGRSLESMLDRRIIWKQTVLNGNLQSEIHRLLTENIIDPEDPDRAIPSFVLETTLDPDILTLAVNAQYFGEYLYDVITGLCEGAGISFKITLNANNQFVFKLYSGKDRSFAQIENPFVAFSPELDNLSDTNYHFSVIPYKTATLIAGEGEGDNRLTTQVMLPSGGGSGLSRREKFTDARDVSMNYNGEIISQEEYYTLLIQRGYISLLDSTKISSFEGKADTTINYVYGIDFFLGDILQVSNQYGLANRTRVVEMIYSEDQSGIETNPTFQIV